MTKIFFSVKNKTGEYMQPEELLKKFYGYSTFRKGQLELINASISGKDTLGIMPTSGGKSICYQLPSLIMEGIVIVISPLISLMKDQVDALNESGIPSAFINSSISFNTQLDILREVSSGKIRILYVAPERLSSDVFLEFTNRISISMVAVDEAHCISQWGHDFRPGYREIPNFIASLKKRPVVGAYTATATSEIIDDIVSLLRLDSPLKVMTGFNRDNLYFHVEKTSDKKKFLLDYIKDKTDAGIIYCSTRKDVETVANILTAHKIKAGFYHAGMTQEERSTVQDDFLFDRIQIIAATNAFGMGIDKSNVRFVIHYNMPKNMEAYYQEAGRAGRDGDKSECILLFSEQDVFKQKYMIEEGSSNQARIDAAYKNLKYMIDYCHTDQCLRAYILRYFGEAPEYEECGFCSNCLDDSETADITIEAQKILSCIYRMDEKFGAALTASVLKGANVKKVKELGFDKLSTFGIMANYSESEIKEIIRSLISKGLIDVSGGLYSTLSLNAVSMKVLKEGLKVFDKVKKKEQAVVIEKAVNNTLFEQLRSLRFTIAQDKGVPPFIIFDDSSLREMCRYLPSDRNSMLSIKGVGAVKFEKYGKLFIPLINKFREENNLSPEPNTDIPKNRKDKVTKTGSGKHLESYKLFNSGKSISQIAELMSYTEDTILNHIKKADSEGYAVNWEKIVDPYIEQAVLSVVKQVGAGYLKTIKDKLPDNVSYLDIKKVLYKNESFLKNR